MSGATPRDRVAAAFAAAPRAWFLPGVPRPLVDADRPVRIGWGQTCSQPRTVEAMLRLLDVRPGQRVLDVGSGSGWTTALLALLTGSAGSVLGVELEPDLVKLGRDNLRAVDAPWARVEPADPDVLGRPAEAPFDRILVSAEATVLPEQLVTQLADDGILVVPVASVMTRVALRDGERHVTEHGRYAFVPLR